MIATPLLAALALASPAPHLTAKPGFDCAKARSPGERLVCRDPALAAADCDMTALYRSALAASADPGALRLNQRDALAARNACTTRACVADWYEGRRRILGPRMSPAPDAKTPAPLEPVPTRVGGCVTTHVLKVGFRLDGVADSGSLIAYADGLSQVSYAPVPGIGGSKRGDAVRVCLVSRPRGCPAGDTRGSIYAARNQRTGARWTAGDSSHQCGGA